MVYCDPRKASRANYSAGTLNTLVKVVQKLARKTVIFSMFKMVDSHSLLAIHDAVHNYPDQFEMCGLPFYEQGSPIGFLNPTIPTKIFPLSRNPERFYRPIPIPVIFSNVLTSQHDVQINSVGGNLLKRFRGEGVNFRFIRITLWTV